MLLGGSLMDYTLFNTTRHDSTSEGLGQKT